MQGAPNSSGAYGYVYVTNTFTNVSVQAQVRFSTSNAWGGGIGGYLNTNTGAHYAAWLYPENSAGGGPAIRLVKFSTWTSFGYETTNFGFMGVTSVTNVGTNLHTLRLALSNQTVAGVLRRDRGHQHHGRRSDALHERCRQPGYVHGRDAPI